ncbi:MAG: nucleotidyltransferase domain-containing protein, partial [Boseongicola sp.]|nr:nucleotidyltransferase domain-containing protein [Boseongicola sp.]
MNNRLVLPTRHRRVVEELLREYVPEAEVWAYGSRVSGHSHDGSDLDLVVRGPGLQPLGAELVDLIEALRESNIPILVQVHDRASLPHSFRRQIERAYMVLQH